MSGTGRGPGHVCSNDAAVEPLTNTLFVAQLQVLTRQVVFVLCLFVRYRLGLEVSNYGFSDYGGL